MKKVIVITCSVLLSGFLFAQDTVVKKLDDLLTAYARLGRLNGAVLVAQHGNILLQKGYGIKNAVNKTMNDAAAQFQVASVTKQFTAAVVLKLVEQKKMALTDKLGKYFSGFVNGDSISIEQLLTHTSGIKNFTEEDTTIEKTNQQQMLTYLKRLPPDFSPGTNWHYSNSGYVLLGYIIEKVSGISYWQAVRKYIFEPLHMNNSGFDFTHLNSADKATGYDELNDSVNRPASLTDSTTPSAAGAIYSTVKDMYQWHLGLQQYKIVGKELMDKAYTPCANHNYGYGWQIDSPYGHRMISHSGSISGFGSNFARVTEDDICIVLLSNKGGSTGELMHITERLLAVLYNQYYSMPVKRVPVAVSEEVLKRYIGTYEIADMHLTIDISINNGLFIAQPYRDAHPGPTSVMLAMDDKHFYDQRDEEVEITFDTDPAGKGKGVTIRQMGTTKYANKIK